MLLLAHLFGPACRLARYETMTARRTGQTMPAQTCLASTTAKTLLPRLTNRRRARTIGGMAAHTGRLCVLPWFIPHSTPSRNLVGGFWNAGNQGIVYSYSSRSPAGTSTVSQLYRILRSSSVAFAITCFFPGVVLSAKANRRSLAAPCFFPRSTGSWHF